ncbi:MAG: hypothetical protein KA506_11490 [Steroidobacteraceae bacterium]|nr:hypothetical protein [Steroidobacteraceae bacterium]
MKKNHSQHGASPVRNSRGECCTDAPCDSGLRNQYFEGKRLTADSFTVEQDYAIGRRRLLNRTIHGWGVVYGYALKGAPAKDGDKDQWGRLLIGPGLALDECGRELLRTRPISLGVGDTSFVDDKGASFEKPPEGSYQLRAVEGKEADTGPRACWLLSVHYAEQLVGPNKVSDPCSCERDEWDHVCETVRFSLRRVDCKACCARFDCELTCGCGTGPCCGEQALLQAKENSRQDEAPRNPANRGGCQCLCEHLTGLSDVECGGLCELDDPCVRIRADLRHGVPLACVSLREGKCDGEWGFESWFDACGPRRLVKNNDVLFDLIRGCDLTRISAIGWADWHRSRKLIDWDAFKASFGTLSDSDFDRMQKTREKRERFPVGTLKYWVEFSRPVRQDTVRADCFSMTVLVAEEEGGWTGTYRVPILKAETWAPPGTPAGLVSRATVVVDGRWLYDAVRGTKTIFDEHPITIEIEVHGDLIVDCNGQTVDANAHGLSPAPSGNGTPGGTFFSRFQVQPRFAADQVDSAYRTEGVES